MKGEREQRISRNQKETKPGWEPPRFEFGGRMKKEDPHEDAKKQNEVETYGRVLRWVGRRRGWFSISHKHMRILLGMRTTCPNALEIQPRDF